MALNRAPPRRLERSSPIASRQFSLRERKFARTKLALLQAALERMRDKKLDEIPVKELCDEVEVSEATFFNYFPKKNDLLHYLIQVWTIEVAWHAQSTVGEECGLRFIEQVFDYTGKKLADHPRLMLEIIAHMALEPHPSACPKHATRSSAWLNACRLSRMRGRRVRARARRCRRFSAPRSSGRLRAASCLQADIEAAVLVAARNFLRRSALARPARVRAIRPAYQRQLKLLWAGLRCR